MKEWSPSPRLSHNLSRQLESAAQHQRKRDRTPIWVHFSAPDAYCAENGIPKARYIEVFATRK
jgi:hypothetical protein